MSFFDSILGQIGGLDPATIAARVGLTPEQVQAAIAALGQQHDQPGDTVDGAAAQTGLPTDQLRQVLDHLGGEGALDRLSGMLGQTGAGGLGGMLSGFFERK